MVLLFHLSLRLFVRRGVSAEECHLRVDEDQGCVLVEGGKASPVGVPNDAGYSEVLLADRDLAD